MTGNPKFEFRNSKQIQITQTKKNLKSGLKFENSDLGIVSDFRFIFRCVLCTTDV
jgi:hypothetical protein